MTLSKRRKILLGGTPDEIRALFAADATNRLRDHASDHISIISQQKSAVPKPLQSLYSALNDPALAHDPCLNAVRAEIVKVRNDSVALQTARNTPSSRRSTVQNLALLP